jgi:predicted ATPase
MIILIEDTDRFFVLTGGPGSGKTTLIAALGEVG